MLEDIDLVIAPIREHRADIVRTVPLAHRLTVTLRVAARRVESLLNPPDTDLARLSNLTVADALREWLTLALAECGA